MTGHSMCECWSIAHNKCDPLWFLVVTLLVDVGQRQQRRPTGPLRGPGKRSWSAVPGCARNVKARHQQLVCRCAL